MVLLIDDAHHVGVKGLSPILAIWNRIHTARGTGTPIVLCGNNLERHLKQTLAGTALALVGPVPREPARGHPPRRRRAGHGALDRRNTPGDHPQHRHLQLPWRDPSLEPVPRQHRPVPWRATPPRVRSPTTRSGRPSRSCRAGTCERSTSPATAWAGADRDGDRSPRRGSGHRPRPTQLTPPCPRRSSWPARTSAAREGSPSTPSPPWASATT